MTSIPSIPSINATPPDSPKTTNTQKLKPPALPPKRPRDKGFGIITPPASPRLRSECEVVLTQQSVSIKREQSVECSVHLGNVEVKQEKQLLNDKNNNDNSKSTKVPDDKQLNNKENALGSPQIQKHEKSPTHQRISTPSVKEEDEEVEVVMREKVG